MAPGTFHPQLAAFCGQLIQQLCCLFCSFLTKSLTEIADFLTKMCIFAPLKSPLVLYLRVIKSPKAVQIRRVRHFPCLFHIVKQTERKRVPIP